MCVISGTWHYTFINSYFYGMELWIYYQRDQSYSFQLDSRMQSFVGDGCKSCVSKSARYLQLRWVCLGLCRIRYPIVDIHRKTAYDPPDVHYQITTREYKKGECKLKWKCPAVTRDEDEVRWNVCTAPQLHCMYNSQLRRTYTYAGLIIFKDKNIISITSFLYSYCIMQSQLVSWIWLFSC